MNQAMTEAALEQENRTFHGSGGVSAGNRGRGFRPAFRDDETGEVFASCFADGQLAPFHLLDGLPERVVLRRHGSGGVAVVKASVVCGFVRDERFYTRAEAARAVEDEAAQARQPIARLAAAWGRFGVGAAAAC